MGILRKMIAVCALVGLVVGDQLNAQPAADPAGDDKDVTIALTKQAKLSPQEMTAKAQALTKTMQWLLKRVLDLQQVARKAQDVVKLNCVNVKLLQIKQLLKIADAARNNLTEAIASQNESDRYHQFGQVSISKDKATVLRDEAEACSFKGGFGPEIPRK